LYFSPVVFDFVLILTRSNFAQSYYHLICLFRCGASTCRRSTLLTQLLTLPINPEQKSSQALKIISAKILAFAVCTASFNIINVIFCPFVFVRLVWILGQTVNFARYSIQYLVFITEMTSVYCAVRTGSLNRKDHVSSLQIFRIAFIFNHLWILLYLSQISPPAS